MKAELVQSLTRDCVAMTRPTHLLCLAMKRSTLKVEHMKAIQTRGWRPVQVQPDGSTVPLKPMQQKKI